MTVGERDVWAELFAELTRFCPQCGWAPAGKRCPVCRSPTDVASTTPTRLLGRWAEVRRRMTHRQGVVVRHSADGVTILGEDGRTTDAKRDRMRLVDRVGGVDADLPVRSGAGELLAAARTAGLSETMRAELVSHAVAAADGSGNPLRRALVVDAITLGHPLPIVDRLGFSSSERTWWRAVAQWRGGELAAAAVSLLGLPDEGYPLRLAMWWQAAAAGQVAAADRRRVAASALQLGELSPVCEVAARLVVRAIAEGRSDRDDAGLVGAASPVIDTAPAGSPWATAGRWFRGELGDATRSRLVGALRSSPARLGSDPKVLDAAPPEVLDDLIDQAAVQDTWIERAEELWCGDYLLARTRIGVLDDEALRRVGAFDELARRWARDGRGLPPDIPQRVGERYAALAQARSQDEPDVLALASALGGNTEELRGVLADPASLPATEVLAHGPIADALVDRSTIDPAGLVPDDLSGDQRRFVSRVLLRRAKAALHEWDLDAAAAATIQCLRLGPDDDCNDEALNILAAVHWQGGDDRAARGVLEATGRGAQSDGLLVNAAVVASGLDPRSATLQLVRLVDAGSHPGLRARAALRAASAIGDQTLRSDVVGALRTVAREPIPIDDFAAVVKLLSNRDPEWLAAPTALAGSPHADSAPAQVFVAWAAGRDDNHVAALATALDGDAPAWASQWRDELVDWVVDWCRDAEGRRRVAMSVGYAVLRGGLSMDPARAVELRALLVEATARAARDAESEPLLATVGWLHDATDELARVPDPTRTRLVSLVTTASRELSHAIVDHRSKQLARFEDLADGRWTMPPDALRVTAQRGIELCKDTSKLMARLIPLLDETDWGTVNAVTRRCHDVAVILVELARG